MLGLSFLSPLFLVGALAAAVPFVLHLFAREAAPTVAFSTVRFIRRAPVEQTRRRRVSDLLLLALRMAALALLAVVFARPFLGSGDAATAPVTVVAVDRSLSVSAPAQWQAVMARAREAIEEAPARALVAVLAFDERVDVVLEPTNDRGAARAMLDAIVPTAGAADFTAALARGVDVLDGRDGDIVVVSDLQRSGDGRGLSSIVPASATVRVKGVAPATSNLSVRSVVREDEATSVVVVNHGAGARSTRVSLVVDEGPLAEMTVDVGPGAVRDVRLPAALPHRGVASARVDDGEGPSLDDAYFVVLDPRPPLRVAIVTAADAAPESSLYLERALRPTEGHDVVEAVVVPATSASLGEAGAFGDAAVVIVAGTRGLDRRARERLASFVREGGGLLLVAGPDTEAGVVRDLLAPDLQLELRQADAGAWPATFAASDARHPVFAAMGPFVASLADVRVHDGVRIEPTAGWRAIARFTNDQAALVEARLGEGRVVVFASDLGQRWNQWPVHPTFVPWVHETVAHLGAVATVPRTLPVSEAPEGVARVPGTFEMGSPARRVALNADPRASSIAVYAEAEFLGSIRTQEVDRARLAGRASATREAEQGFWRLALVLLIGLLVAESIVSSRAPGPSPSPASGD